MINYQRIGSMHLSKHRTRSRLPDAQRDRSTDHALSSSAPSSHHDLTSDIADNSSLRFVESILICLELFTKLSRVSHTKCLFFLGKIC